MKREELEETVKHDLKTRVRGGRIPLCFTSVLLILTMFMTLAILSCDQAGEQVLIKDTIHILYPTEWSYTKFLKKGDIDIMIEVIEGQPMLAISILRTFSLKEILGERTIPPPVLQEKIVFKEDSFKVTIPSDGEYQFRIGIHPSARHFLWSRVSIKVTVR